MDRYGMYFPEDVVFEKIYDVAEPVTEDEED